MPGPLPSPPDGGGGLPRRGPDHRVRGDCAGCGSGAPGGVPGVASGAAGRFTFSTLVMRDTSWGRGGGGCSRPPPFTGGAGAGVGGGSAGRAGTAPAVRTGTAAGVRGCGGGGVRAVGGAGRRAGGRTGRGAQGGPQDARAQRRQRRRRGGGAGGAAAGRPRAGRWSPPSRSGPRSGHGGRRAGGGGVGLPPGGGHLAGQGVAQPVADADGGAVAGEDLVQGQRDCTARAMPWPWAASRSARASPTTRNWSGQRRSFS